MTVGKLSLPRHGVKLFLHLLRNCPNITISTLVTFTSLKHLENWTPLKKKNKFRYNTLYYNKVGTTFTLHNTNTNFPKHIERAKNSRQLRPTLDNNTYHVSTRLKNKCQLSQVKLGDVLWFVASFDRCGGLPRLLSSSLYGRNFSIFTLDEEAVFCYYVCKSGAKFTNK